MAHRFRGERKSDRIMLKYSFSRFRNTAADPIIIDFDDSEEEVKLPQENIHPEQQPLHEAAELMVDLVGEDEPQKMESLSDTSSNEEDRNHRHWIGSHGCPGYMKESTEYKRMIWEIVAPFWQQYKGRFGAT